ncbi:MAG: HAD family hydrolase [Coprococcus sp.]
MVGAVVFDMDGVILDSEQLVVRSWQKIAGKYGIENIEGFCMAALGLNREAAKKLFVRMYDGRYGDEERYEVLKAEMASEFHRAAADGELVLKHGVADTLKLIRDKNIPCALATSTRKEVVTMELTNLGVIAYFDKLICGDMVERSKPAPDIFLKAWGARRSSRECICCGGFV